ncbi:hypothetical protein M0638_11175 [Roseomonas sp. NAR14]|uniref:Uncharacterized protein n=1 Tax=Roseomonas acroporae TaxID=2937791 RepID=A0A9X1Y843_9PROT|nr:hypothetical protein [Roseomonas acroporae]MCK8784943.1 hypothetical protein [Roseomonas acroporae]
MLATLLLSMAALALGAAFPEATRDALARLATLARGAATRLAARLG